MATMSISLSDKMRAFVKSRVESGDYHNESEYIRDLIRRESEKSFYEQQLLSSLEHADQSGDFEGTVYDALNLPPQDDRQ